MTYKYFLIIIIAGFFVDPVWAMKKKEPVQQCLPHYSVEQAGQAAKIAYSVRNVVKKSYSGQIVMPKKYAVDGWTEVMATITNDGLVAWAGIKDCVLYIAFKGTSPDWASDLQKDIEIGVGNLIKKAVGRVPTVLEVFQGKSKYAAAVTSGSDFVREVEKAIKAEDRKVLKKVVFTGHSLGGALAQSIYLDFLKYKRSFKKYKTYLYTYNAPSGEFWDAKMAKQSAYTTTATHVGRKGDLIKYIGKKSGEKFKLPSKEFSRKPLKAHNIDGVNDAIKELIESKENRTEKVK